MEFEESPPSSPMHFHPSSFQEIEDKIQVQYPRYFSGKTNLDRSVIENYRKSWTHFTGKNKNVFFVLHNPTLLPLLEQLKISLRDYGVQNTKHAEVTKHFIREIQFYHENSAVSSRWLENLFPRFLCAVSINTPEEEDFFAHFPYPHSELFPVLKENEAWKTHEATMQCVNRYHNSLLEGPRYQYSVLSLEMIQAIEEAVENALPVKIVYPLWGMGKLGPAFIVKTMLEDIFLIGLPLKSLTAHGIPLSRYGFAFHDRFHETVDHRRLEFIQHVITQAEEYITTGGSLQNYISHIIPSHILKYQRLMGGLQEIYERLIATFDQLDSRKAMLGFFLILHEESNFPSVIYSLKNFDDILSVITEDDGEPLENEDDVFYNLSIDTKRIPLLPMLENMPDSKYANDPFETSPLDGSSSWTDEQLIAWVINNMKVRKARKYAFMAYSDDEDKSINKNDIIKQKVKRSQRYIDITFTLRQGGELNYSFQTLFYSLNAIHESLKLLNLIGIKVPLPDLSSSSHPSETAQYFIKKGERTMESLIRHFCKVASVFANENISGKGSLIERYKQLQEESNLEKPILN